MEGDYLRDHPAEEGEGLRICAPTRKAERTGRKRALGERGVSLSYFLSPQTSFGKIFCAVLRSTKQRLRQQVFYIQ